MKTENEIIEVEGGWKLSNGNASSKKTYKTWDEAVEACKADEAAWEEAEDAAEAADKSPVEWDA